MSSGIVFSSTIIKNSIVGSNNTSSAKDNTNPFSFLEFITNTGVDYTPEQYNNFYLYYLKEWADITNTKTQTQQVDYINLYIDFLQELTITFSTIQEQKFLSKIDFNDPVSLDIIIPFYTEKIRQVILFYKEKRDTAKFVIERNKIKGTALSVERALYEKIYEYVFGSQETPQYNSLTQTLSNLTTNLSIDIHEFVDVYSQYFDLPSINTPFVQVNKESINTSLFFEDPQLVFRSTAFLTNIPLAVNVQLSYDSICDPTNPQALARNECLNKTGFTEGERVALKINYLKKYAGVDMQYIDTTASPYVSGTLFTADTPTNNIQNLQSIYTPTAESNEIKLLRDIGLFFKPDKQGLFQLNSNNYTYRIDTTKLEPNKVYIFPNPAVYGNVGVDSKVDYPLVFIYDNRPDIKNITSSFAIGDPNVTNHDQTFSPYYSREQSTKHTEAKDSPYSLNFNDLFNKGYITRYQTDIYGNEYALFKDSFGQSFKEIQTVESQSILNLLLNGHEFFDTYEGYNFDYSVASRNGTTVRSGISSLTVNYPFSPSSPYLTPSFYLSGTPYYLYFREFAPYQELNLGGGFNNALISDRSISAEFKDGGGFTFINGDPLPDPLFAGDSNYPSYSPYYYSVLLDAGVSSLDPLTRAFNDFLATEFNQPLLTEDNITITSESIDNSNFLLDVKYALSAIGAYNYDCGYFTDNIYLNNDYNYGSDYSYIDSQDPNGVTVVSSLTGNDIYRALTYKNELEGKAFVKNATLSNSQPLSSALNVIFDKYAQSVRNEIYTAPKNLEVFYDSICIETDNYLVFDKIVYSDGSFKKPSTRNTVYSYSENDLSVFSNRFYKEKDNTIIFCTLQKDTALSSKNIGAIYPKLHLYDIESGSSKLLYPNITNNTSVFNLSSIFTNDFNINIINIEKPVLTYNHYNDVYKLTYIAEDNNSYFHVFDILFDIDNDTAQFKTIKFYRSDNKTYKTTNYSLSDTIFSSINTIQGTYNISTTTSTLSL